MKNIPLGWLIRILFSVILIAITIPENAAMALLSGKMTSYVREEAEKGNAEAQFELGWRYLSGLGAEQNTEEGLKWIEKAAEQGIVVAQYELGKHYLLGLYSVEQNKEDAHPSQHGKHHLETAQRNASQHPQHETTGDDRQQYDQIEGDHADGPQAGHQE